MSEKGVLADGTRIDGQFSMLVGAVANPFLKPLELNMLRLNKKIEVGARFIQTQAVFDVETFGQWLDAVRGEGITKKAAILAGVLPLDGAAEAQKLRDTYTDYYIGDKVVERLKAAGNDAAQKKEGGGYLHRNNQAAPKDGWLERDTYSFGRQRESSA
jgi:methylenetetrahydrofolate reductase (NADPH)